MALKKVLLIGEPAVGKSSLARRFVDNEFDDKYIASIGTNVKKKNLAYEKTNLTLMIYDILGQHEGGTEPPYHLYMRGTDGVLAVFDITRPETAKAIYEFWVPKVKEIAGEVPIVVLGNKHDLQPGAYIGGILAPVLAGLKETGNTNLEAMLASAKTGDNVEKAFYLLGKMTLESRGK